MSQANMTDDQILARVDAAAQLLQARVTAVRNEVMRLVTDAEELLGVIQRLEVRVSRAAAAARESRQ